jgi:hypothetical protein
MEIWISCTTEIVKFHNSIWKICRSPWYQTENCNSVLETSSWYYCRSENWLNLFREYKNGKLFAVSVIRSRKLSVTFGLSISASFAYYGAHLIGHSCAAKRKMCTIPCIPPPPVFCSQVCLPRISRASRELPSLPSPWKHVDAPVLYKSSLIIR